ncbi:MAG: Fe2+-dependent dioxygenase [Kofleriaceae bacterium]
MYRIIPDVISPSVATSLVSSLATAPFASGSVTAGKANRGIKNNLELPELSSLPTELVAAVTKGIRSSALLQAYAMPRRSTALLFNRFDEGMYYGDHVDNPTHAFGTTVTRADLSLTLFLSAPETYDGGELVLDTDNTSTAIKLPAGHAVVYQTGVVHRVNVVTRGTRLAVVAWLESSIADHEERQIVFDLVRARDALGVDGPREPRQWVDKAIVNLTRKWMR